MLSSIKKLLRPERAQQTLPAVPEGERYYVIGDIHGCLEHFAALADAIDADAADNAAYNTTVVLLGDLVDRGPDSAGVIAKAREWGEQRSLRFLAGNHEEMFLESFSDLEMLRHFVKHGGRETILSYGIPKKEYRELTLEELQDKIGEIVPQADRDFLASFEEMIIAGDYVFAHAGIDPSRPLDDQRRKDLLWIRERFLRSTEPLSHVIVHGHTIFEDVEDCGTRIGIDTGAFRTGILTALVLEGSARRTIQAVEKDGQIQIKKTEDK
ncbi:metallophosphoesterase family protein [Erythrobacter sp. W53]|uniref:metallophosphoesterase family protein n=1 Tax=Erythrobacter sp. W53 TaxID=3425947 RepID=UPI003D76777E